ncbi:H-X9-DG-CTERM domain-containing protein [uncultured Victivallis sp.]|uniref:H-X9-DG-CTERM domain-containing protein n=1 Tax=uncultured Victivallis sp. TaxID=354118 RepID=UPI00338F083B
MPAPPIITGGAGSSARETFERPDIRHNGAANALFLDGHVAALRPATPGQPYSGQLDPDEYPDELTKWK